MRVRRARFSELIDRQLDIFEREQRWLIEDCVAAERAYNRAPRDEAEERYGDYVDLVETGTEVLADSSRGSDEMCARFEHWVGEHYPAAPR